MTDIVWRRVRAGVYESEAGLVIRAARRHWNVYPTGAKQQENQPNVRDAKAACERAYRERVAEEER